MANEQIEQLIERYLNGETSREEELLLRNFFCRNYVAMPEEWKVYRAMFGYVKTQAESQDAKAGRQKAAEAARMSVKGRRKTIALHPFPPSVAFYRHPVWIGIAVSVAVLVMMAIFLPKPYVDYAMINGEKTTDPQQIMNAADEALQMVSCSEDETFGALKELQQINNEI